ncbi:hypothetical protein MOB18_20150 [Bacillus inaquosorum]|uniref:hypothetical protein n=1 Tax=Bacillus inaquosorum TaxID=483913 RepID=UPI0022818541|nr:hypothetical protein [Bacillus inaquosorum]MCY7751378.1 hypothetical protein [Bacillus inaquosorum]
MANNVDRYHVDMEKNAASYLNSLETALSEGRNRALNELKQADTFINKIFNRKKIDQLAKKAYLYSVYENNVKGSDFKSRFANFEISAPGESSINIREFGKQIESAIGTYFKEQGVQLTPENSIQAYLDVVKTMGDLNNKQIETADNTTNSYFDDLFKEKSFREKIKQVHWHPIVPHPLTYDQNNQNKSKYLEQLSKDDVLMKKSEKDLSTERELENKGTEKGKVEVQIKKASNTKGSTRVKGLER